MEHYIKQNSTEPLLVVTIYNDEKYFKEPFQDRIENSVISFTMQDDKGAFKILNAPCYLIKNGEDYDIVYKWTMKDTKTKGVFNGNFTIQFLGDDYDVMSQTILPIKEDLLINII
jgi:hypothetical protein